MEVLRDDEGGAAARLIQKIRKTGAIGMEPRAARRGGADEGAGCCGEGALAGVIAAIATATSAAGVTVDALPLTPERVWRGIDRSNEEVRT